MTGISRKALSRRAGWLGGAAIAAAAVSFAVLPAHDAPAHAVGESVAPVFSQPLPNVPGSSLTAVVVDYAPGGKSDAHHHAGSVFAYVLSGEILSKLDDGPEVVYHAGESFFEPPGTRHAVSANASQTEPARLLAIIVAETGAKLTVSDE